MRWAIRYSLPNGETALLPGRHDSSAEAHLRAAELRALDNGRAYRVVRLVTRSERLQRELDEAQRMLADTRVERDSEVESHEQCQKALRRTEDARDKRDSALTRVRRVLDAAGVRDTEPAPPLPPVMNVERMLSQDARVALLVSERLNLRRQLDEARAAVGEAWFADGTRTLAQAIAAKFTALERLANGEGR